MKSTVKIHLFILSLAIGSYFLFSEPKDTSPSSESKTHAKYLLNKGKRYDDKVNRRPSSDTNVKSKNITNYNRSYPKTSPRFMNDSQPPVSASLGTTANSLTKSTGSDFKESSSTIIKGNQRQNDTSQTQTSAQLKKSIHNTKEYLGVPDQGSTFVQSSQGDQAADNNLGSSESSTKTSSPESTTIPVIKGKVPPLEGIITVNTGGFINSAYAAASNCINPKITIFDLDTMSVLSNNPISENDLTTQTAFEFKPDLLNLDLNKPTKYILKTSGCDINYERIITSYYSSQDLTPTTTLVSKIINSATTVNVKELNGPKLEELIKSVDSKVLSTDEISSSYNIIESDIETQQKFEEVFEGENYSLLANSAPDITTLSIPTTLQEGITSSLSAQSTHWKSDYIIGYEWKIDGTPLSNSAIASYTPSSNSKRQVELELVIGKAIGAQGSGVDLNEPHHVMTYTISISDEVITTPPDIELNASITEPTSNQNIVLDIATGPIVNGIAQNCESFSDMAITVGTAQPTDSDFTYTCTTPTTQLISYSLPDQNGNIQINLWARDINKTVSAKKTVSLTLDKAPPQINFTNIQSLYRADSDNILSWTITEAHQDLANQHTVEFFDGNSWTTLPSVASANGSIIDQPFSTTHRLPNITSTQSKYRITLSDALGNTQVKESSLISVQRAELSITPSSISFSDTDNKSTGVEQVFTITNNASVSTQQCSPASINGANALDFEITDDSCTNQDLTPAQSCTITLRPKPLTKGSKSAQLSWNCGLDSVTASLSYNSINNEPVNAINYSISASEDLTMSFNAQAALDDDQDSLTYTITSAPIKGTLNNCMNNDTDLSCNYIPNNNVNGVDSFSYRAYDGTHYSQETTISINISATNDAPTLPLTQTLTAQEDTALSFSLNPGSDIDGDPLTYTVTQGPVTGALNCVEGNSTSCTYMPVQDDISSYSFKYKVSDSLMDSGEATVTINISNTNDAPVMIGDQSITTSEDTPVAFSLSGATDIDPAQTLAYKVITQPSNGTISNCIDTVTYKSDITCDYTPNSNFFGTDTFSYRANDGSTDSSSVSIVTINVTPVNDAPSLAASQNISTNEDTSITFTLAQANDIEADSLTYIKLSDPSSGSLSCDGGTSRTCTYTPVQDYNGSTSFSYKTNDGDLESNSSTVNIAVIPINDAPTITAPQSITTSEDSSITFDLNIGQDIDGDSLTYIKTTDPASGSMTCIGSSSRSCTYTPASDFNGTTSFNYKVNDGALDSNSQAVTITITPINDAPTLVSPQTLTTTEDTPLNFNLTQGNDIESDTLSYIKVSDPASGSLTCTGGISRSCIFTPTQDFNGTTTFTYKVNDGSIDSNTATVNINVTPANDLPVVASDQSLLTDDNVGLSFSISSASDMDGDAVSYKIITPVQNGVLSNCITTGSYSTDLDCDYQANANFNGTDSFTYIANDGSGDSTSQATVTITVSDKTPPSAPPVILAHSQYRNTQNQSFSATSCTDINAILINEGPMPNSTDPAWQTCTTTTSALSYTLATSTQGQHDLNIWAKDDQGNVSTLSTSASVIYDTVSPIVSVTTPTSSQGGTDTVIDWSVSELNIQSSTPQVLEYFDGVSWNALSTISALDGPLNSQVFSTNWSIPTFDSNNAKVRISVTDRAGNQTVAESGNFTIDSTAPAIASMTFEVSEFTNSSSVSLTMQNCNDTSKVIILETDVVPDVSDVNWQSCSLTAGNYSHTISSVQEGSNEFYVYAIDAYNNISQVKTLTAMYDTIAPTISFDMTSFIKGNATADINFNITDKSTSQTQNILIEYHDGVSWSSTNISAADGPIIQKAFSSQVTTPNTDNLTLQFRVTFSDLAGNQTVETTSLTTDTSAPVLTSLSLNSGATTTDNNNVTVSLGANDTVSNITKFCLKVDSDTQPNNSDPCWTSVDAPSPGISPSSSISFSNFYFLIGFAPANYNIYAWVMDSAQNISTNSSSLNTDLYAMTFTPGTPPVASDALAVSTDSPASPPTLANFTSTAGSDLFVSWNASDTEGLDANPISLKYSTDDVNFQDLPGGQNLLNSTNGSCTLSGSFTGCAVISSPTSGYFKVRVIVKDNTGTTVFYNTPVLNETKLRIIAGNTEHGLDGSARTAVFYRYGLASSAHYSHKKKLVVSDDGKFFYLDPSRGLLWVNPTTGNLENFINITGSSTGDGGPFSSATLKSAQAIDLDHENNLLIWDGNRIRSVNLSTSIITTLLGGGSQTNPLVTVDASDISLGSFHAHQSTLTPLPNGDLIFTAPANSLNHRRYRKADGKIELIQVSGQGVKSDPTFSWSSRSKYDLGLVYNPSTSALNFMVQNIHKSFSGDSYPMPVRIDHTSGNATTPYTAVAPYDLIFYKTTMYTGLDGKLYHIPRFRAGIYLFDHNTNTHTRILGTGSYSTSPCPDGTAATSCAVDLDTAFITKSGNIYFIDNGLYRTVDSQGNVLTLFGQFSGYGDGVIATSSRIANVSDINLRESSSPNKFVFLDRVTNKLREFEIDGNISHVAPANAGWSGPFAFETNKATGDIYLPYGGTIIKIDNIDNTISNVIGGGANQYHLPETDGKIGAEINLISSYRNETNGFIDGKLYYRKHSWSGSNYGCTIKAYDVNDSYRQSNIMSNSSATCSLNITLGNNLSSSSTSGSFKKFRKFEDPSDGVTKTFFSNSTSNKIYSSLNGGPISEFVTLPRSMDGYDYNIDGTGLNFYYCSSGKLYKYNYNTSAETLLSWNSTTISCASSRLVYHNSRNSIIFGFKQNGLWGVGEYSLD